MTPDEMQGKMQQTKAQLDQMLGAVAPGAKIFGKVFAFIAIAIFVVAAVLIASIFMKVLRQF